MIVSTNMYHYGKIADTPADNTMGRYFTGRVEIKKMVSELQSKEVEMFLVSFFKGARTKIHYHETDQILLATEDGGALGTQSSVKSLDGSGGAARIDFEVRRLAKGDFVCIPAGTWHWHGAAEGVDFAHLQAKRPGKTVWLED